VNNFNFPSLIYSGYDYPADGIGNHLSLLDRLVFNSIPYTRKSLHALATPFKNHPPYAGVRNFDHLNHPGDFKNSLYIDISRDMCDPYQVELSIQRAIAHKHAFNSVTALYLMWESDQLSQVLEKLPNAYDFVIVTSNLLDKYLEKKGVNVSHLPHPYDYANITEAKPHTEKDGLVFGISCGLWPRKNVALLASVFAEIFGNDPRYILKIHTRFDPELSDFTSEYTKLSELLNCNQNIQLESVSLDRKGYLAWMRSLDVYCFISSGEGYSITPREALHLGIPVILLDAHVHHEFIHLPGVIRVAAKGKKNSTPNHHEGDPDQGYDWKVDEHSLQEAIQYIAEHYSEVQQSLLNKYSQILEFHDINRIKQSWVNELNRQYITHLGSTSHYLPKILLADKENYQVETKTLKLDMQSQMKDPLTNYNTGEKTNKGVFCFPSRHQPGHCVFGQNVYPIENKMTQVRFYIDLLYNQFGNEPLVSLDVYDNNSDVVLVFQTLTIIDFINSPENITLEFNATPEQRLEFRVFWHGHYDICVRNVKLNER
jgi:glycosyltransferase involved in cell wall biosynthesis